MNFFLLSAIAEAIKSKIGVTKEKKKIIECQENSRLNRLISLNMNECLVHVVKMSSLNYKVIFHSFSYMVSFPILSLLGGYIYNI